MGIALTILAYFIGIPFGIFLWKLALSPKININFHDKLKQRKK